MLTTTALGKPLTLDAGAGTDRIEIDGTTGDDAIKVAANRVTVGTHTYDVTSATENVHVYGRGGSADVLELLS